MIIFVMYFFLILQFVESLSYQFDLIEIGGGEFLEVRGYLDVTILVFL